MPENFSTMHNEAVSSETASPLIGERNSPSLEQLNYSAKQRKIQRKSHEKTEEIEFREADLELDEFINTHYFGNEEAINLAKEHYAIQKISGINIGEKKLKKFIDDKLDESDKLSVEDKIKNYTESIKDGKSPQEILRLLIANFENEKGVEKLISNFRNFQKLHQFAETKPLAERKAIQKIIAKADFSDEKAFTTSLAEITNSAEISATTKFEISREFGGAHIDSVDGFNYQLKQVKAHKMQLEKAIEGKSREKNDLDSEIKNLEAEIEKLLLNDSKRLELEKQLKLKKRSLDDAETEITRLERAKPNNISFPLREGFNAVQNPDGSRSIKIADSDFLIRLPSNALPFTDTKNLRAINVAFAFAVLKQQNLAGFLFRPNLENGAVPSKYQRDMGHLILSSLGIDDTKILSEENIKQLKKDLSKLNPKNGNTNQENLIELGVFDVASQSLNKNRLKEVLITIRENRSRDSEMIFKK